MIDLYDDADAPPNLPKPRVPLPDIGVKRWHHDLWIKIVEAAIDGNPDKIVIDWHPAFSKPAALVYIRAIRRDPPPPPFRSERAKPTRLRREEPADDDVAVDAIFPVELAVEPGQIARVSRGLGSSFRLR